MTFHWITLRLGVELSRLEKQMTSDSSASLAFFSSFEFFDVSKSHVNMNMLLLLLLLLLLCLVGNSWELHMFLSFSFLVLILLLLNDQWLVFDLTFVLITFFVSFSQDKTLWALRWWSNPQWPVDDESEYSHSYLIFWFICGFWMALDSW